MKVSATTPLSLKYYRSMFNIANQCSHILRRYMELLRIKIFMREFEQRDDDVYISTYMKSGTTMLQMIIYQLFTDGNMEFGHLYDVSPWLEQSIDRGWTMKELTSPRIIKTHSEYRFFSKNMKGRIIYCVRNGMDVAVSKFYHQKNLELRQYVWDDYFRQEFMNTSWFTHVQSWVENRNRLNIHYIQYEDLIQNTQRSIEDIAAFLNVSLTGEIMQRTLERCSFEFMKKNQEKFGARRPKPDARKYDEFLRKGESDQGQFQFSQEQKDWYYRQYNKYLGKYNLGYEFLSKEKEAGSLVAR